MGANYEKNLFRHLEEMFEKVGQLTKETAFLKAQHQKEIEALRAENAELKKEIETLKAENERLKGIINKNSGNSSKPPSSDGFKKIQNSREKSGKRPGGQPGHKGSAPKLFANPDKIEDIKREKCKCGGNVKYCGKYKAKQLVDIDITTNITEYREYEGICECCHEKVKNYSPQQDVITYGNNLKSFSAMLTTEGMVSINRTKQMIFEVTGGVLDLSEGTICKWNKELSVCVQPAIEHIEEKLILEPVLHKDETGVRVNKSLHWLHVLGTAKYTIYYSHKKRGVEADKEMGILPAYRGVLVHDHLKGLYYFICDHAECNAHILRYLRAAIEGKNRKWAQDMIELLLFAKEYITGCGGKPPDLYAVQEIHRLYDQILEQGRLEFLNSELPDYNGEDMKLLRRMKEYKTEHLRFVSDPAVPFDNNQAERDLRMIKAKLKISGCFRADDGGEVFARLKSYSSTLRKNNCNIFEGFKSAFSLLPVHC